MSILDKVASGSRKVFVIGGYAGSGINTGQLERTGVALYGWVDSTLKRVHGVEPKGILHCDNGVDVAYMLNAANYVPEGDSWYIDVNVDKVGLNEAKKLMKMATNITQQSTESKVWVFRVPYSKTRKGFPAYKSLLGVGGDGIWCTYLRRDDIAWLLKYSWDKYIKTLNKMSIQHGSEKRLKTAFGYTLIRWISESYNRDVDSVMKLAALLEEGGADSLGLRPKMSLASAKRSVVNIVGNASSSMEEWVLSVLKNSKGRESLSLNIELGQRLYSASGSKLYPAVMSALNSLIEVKIQRMGGLGYKEKPWGHWLDEDSKRYTRYANDISPLIKKDKWGSPVPNVSLERLINARNVLLSQKNWYKPIDVYLWVYKVGLANKGEEILK